MHINGFSVCSARRKFIYIFVAGSRYLRYNGADNGFLIGGM